jgi:hypothetical protein
MTFREKIRYMYKYIIGDRIYKDKYGVIMIRRSWFSDGIPFLNGLRYNDGTPLTDPERLEINSFLMDAFGDNKVRCE